MVTTHWLHDTQDTPCSCIAWSRDSCIWTVIQAWHMHLPGKYKKEKKTVGSILTSYQKHKINASHYSCLGLDSKTKAGSCGHSSTLTFTVKNHSKINFEWKEIQQFSNKYLILCIQIELAAAMTQSQAHTGFLTFALASEAWSSHITILYHVNMNNLWAFQPEHFFSHSLIVLHLNHLTCAQSCLYLVNIAMCACSIVCSLKWKTTLIWQRDLFCSTLLCLLVSALHQTGGTECIQEVAVKRTYIAELREDI